MKTKVLHVRGRPHLIIFMSELMRVERDLRRQNTIECLDAFSSVLCKFTKLV